MRGEMGKELGEREKSLENELEFLVRHLQIRNRCLLEGTFEFGYLLGYCMANVRVGDETYSELSKRYEEMMKKIRGE